MQHKFKKAQFTIIEITVAMLILAVLLTIIMQFVGSAQSGWSAASGKNTIFENARVAMGLINRQIQGIYYEDDNVPCYHKGTEYTYDDAEDEYVNDSFSFVSYLNEAPSEDCTTNACEVQYQLYYNIPVPGDDIADTAGWLLLSVTGNNNTNKWNFNNYKSKNRQIYGASGNNNVFTADDASHEGYYKLIPYVTEFSFVCYDASGTPISDQSSTKPYSIEVTLSLMNKNSWNKWISIGGKGNAYGSYGDQDNESAKEFREKHQHTFNRTIYIGNR